MVGSPNFVRFVYDGDLSDYAAAAGRRAAGLGADRGAVPRLLRRPGAGDASPPRSTDARTTGRSSRSASRPAGCSPGPRASRPRRRPPIYGGDRRCSSTTRATTWPATTSTNLSLPALDQMSDAAAHATISLAQSTQAINGERGKGNFNVKADGTARSPSPAADDFLLRPDPAPDPTGPARWVDCDANPPHASGGPRRHRFRLFAGPGGPHPRAASGVHSSTDAGRGAWIRTRDQRCIRPPL